MFGMSVEVDDELDKIAKAVDRSIYRNIRHAAFSIRKYIQQSIKRSVDPSAPGEPVATRGRRGNVKNSIFAAVENDNAIIGPRYSFVGVSMEAHEFGKSFHGQDYPARPTSGPALDANQSRFAASFAGSIGE